MDIGGGWGLYYTVLLVTFILLNRVLKVLFTSGVLPVGENAFHYRKSHINHMS